jgi:transposase
MAKPLLSDELWEEITALLPPPKPRRFNFPGRKPVDNRKVFTGILFVLKSGIPWEALPREMGCGSGMTCWRRLYEWQKVGVWQSVHELLVAKLPEADKIDWSRALVGRTSVSTPARPPLEAASQPPAEELQPLPLPDILMDPVPLSERFAA